MKGCRAVFLNGRTHGSNAPGNLKMRTALPACLVMLLTLSVSGCFLDTFDVMKPGVDETVEIGRLVLNIGDAGSSGKSSRTLLPPKLSDVIVRYRITLTKTGSPTRTVYFNKDAVSPTIDGLTAGNWSLTCEALTSTDAVVAGCYLLSFEIKSGGTSTVTVNLTPNDAVQGTLQFEITYPSGAVSGAAVQYGNFVAGSYPTSFITLADGFSRTDTAFKIDRQFTPGQYVFKVALMKDGTELITVSEVAHIYGNLTTTGTIALTEADLTQAPAAPTGLTAAPNGTVVNLRWTRTSNVADSYRVRRSADGGASWVDVATINNPVAEGYDDGTATTPGATYTYQVCAANRRGAGPYAQTSVIRVSGVSIDQGNVTIGVGGTFDFTATVLPANASCKDITWGIAVVGADHATVDANGRVTGTALGGATVMATTKDGFLQATRNVTVSSGAIGITIGSLANPADNPPVVSGVVTLNKNVNQTMNVSVTPIAGATYKWLVDGSDVYQGTATPIGTGSSVLIQSEHIPRLGMHRLAVLATDPATGNIFSSDMQFNVAVPAELSYDGNGNTGGTAQTAASYLPGATVTLEGAGSLDRTGYTLSGWNTKADKSGTHYNLNSASFLMPTADLKLFAEWTAVPYTVTFDPRGGAACTPQTVTYGGAYGALPAPSRPGYASLGWWNGANATGTQITAATVYTGTSNHTLYAKWDGAVWAASTQPGGSTMSGFNAVAVDAAGNTYAAGYQKESGTVVYAPGVSFPTNNSAVGGVTAVLVKYDPSGVAQWVRGAFCAGNPQNSEFKAVAVDNSGNVYVAGYQTGDQPYSYESSSLTGAYPTVTQAILVKYLADGSVAWATIAQPSTTGSSSFNGLAIGDGGSIFAVGSQSPAIKCYYGNTVKSDYTSYSTVSNAVIVNFSPSGDSSRAVGSQSSIPTAFTSVAVRSSGVYAAGYQTGAGPVSYSGKTATGMNGGNNAVIVRYDTSLNSQNASAASVAPGASEFLSVHGDATGLYAAGKITGTSVYNFGTAGTPATTSGGWTADNSVLVRYNDTCEALWARSVTGGGSNSDFRAVVCDGAGNAYAAGTQFGGVTYTYAGGPGAPLQLGGMSYHPSLVKYDLSGNALWAKAVADASNSFFYNGLGARTVASNLYLLTAGSASGNTTITVDDDTSVTPTSAGDNAFVVRYLP